MGVLSHSFAPSHGVCLGSVALVLLVVVGSTRFGSGSCLLGNGTVCLGTPGFGSGVAV